MMGSENSNPYTPPSAVVADVSVASPVEKPVRVIWATRLLWITLVLGVINSAILWPMRPRANDTVVLATQIFTFAILAGLTILLSRGKNWARITYLVLSILGLPGLWFLPELFARSVVSGIINMIQAGLQIYVLYLLFSKASRPWFRHSAGA